MKLLVLRFSAMGDVALLTPVLHALARQHTRLSITLVTRKAFEPFFYNIPGIEVIGVDVDRDYQGILGLYRLYRELRILGPYDYGLDVHGSTRSRLIKFFFKFSRLKFANIVKGRREKMAQTRRGNKQLFQLPHTVERYMHVFERAGIGAEIGNGPWINPDTQSRALAHQYLTKFNLKHKENFWIGIAPFAGHENKMWPITHMKELIRLIRRNLDATLFLFGGPRELPILKTISEGHPGTVLVAGNLPLEGELALIPRLDIMVAMDSLNMHLAALLGTRVLSIWGATHPYSGFGPYGQGVESIVQISTNELPCRPCSIFGNKPCYRGDLACMNWIEPKEVYLRLKSRLFMTDRHQDMPESD